MKNIAETFTPGKATCNFQLIRLTIATLIERLVVGNALISAVIRQRAESSGKHTDKSLVGRSWSIQSRNTVCLSTCHHSASHRYGDTECILQVMREVVDRVGAGVIDAS